MSVAVGNEVPASLDVYCGLLVPVGLRAASCSQRTQKSDPILTRVVNVVAGDHAPFPVIPAPPPNF